MQAFIGLNGGFTNKGNYVWGGALTLAWKQLISNIIKEPIKIQSTNGDALRIVQNFNKSPFISKMLSDSCYYARAGFGNQTIRKINQEVSQKFPDKTTEKLQEDLPADAIVSFAYFLKKMKFNHPFTKANVKFNNQSIAGFEAKNPQQKQQILVHQYQDDENFTIQLKTKAENDEIIVIKTEKEMKPEQVLEKVNGLTQTKSSMGSKDIFTMPKVALSCRRDVNDLLGVCLANQKFNQYMFSKIYEIIKLDIDETGVKVENEGAVMMLKMAVMKPPKIRRFELNKPFWIVMRQKQCHPYFLAYICDVYDKS